MLVYTDLLIINISEILPQLFKTYFYEVQFEKSFDSMKSVDSQFILIYFSKKKSPMIISDKYSWRRKVDLLLQSSPR